jgi:hypothetical protein
LITGAAYPLDCQVSLAMRDRNWTESENWVDSEAHNELALLLTAVIVTAILLVAYIMN